MKCLRNINLVYTGNSFILNDHGNIPQASSYVFYKYNLGPVSLKKKFSIPCSEDHRFFLLDIIS